MGILEYFDSNERLEVSLDSSAWQTCKLRGHQGMNPHHAMVNSPLPCALPRAQGIRPHDTPIKNSPS
jgi:hypothetical protein